MLADNFYLAHELLVGTTEKPSCIGQKKIFI